ncbi:3-coathanger stack domain-containing protein [Emticicia sp. SJ17W-69]|uniref:3-coathanger stack domain-containing protein n=1 Tax=Emticicia sp. SJ17W-69 TaxID=3421657 RepID=UPI003EC08010
MKKYIILFLIICGNNAYCQNIEVDNDSLFAKLKKIGRLNGKNIYIKTNYDTSNFPYNTEIRSFYAGDDIQNSTKIITLNGHFSDFVYEKDNVYYFTYRPKNSDNNQLWRTDGSINRTFVLHENYYISLKNSPEPYLSLIQCKYLEGNSSPIKSITKITFYTKTKAQYDNNVAGSIWTTDGTVAGTIEDDVNIIQPISIINDTLSIVTIRREKLCPSAIIPEPIKIILMDYYLYNTQNQTYSFIVSAINSLTYFLDGNDCTELYKYGNSTTLPGYLLSDTFLNNHLLIMTTNGIYNINLITNEKKFLLKNESRYNGFFTIKNKTFFTVGRKLYSTDGLNLTLLTELYHDSIKLSNFFEYNSNFYFLLISQFYSETTYFTGVFKTNGEDTCSKVFDTVSDFNFCNPYSYTKVGNILFCYQSYRDMTNYGKKVNNIVRYDLDTQTVSFIPFSGGQDEYIRGIKGIDSKVYLITFNSATSESRYYKINVNLGDVQIQNLSEITNQTSYQVPQGATIHHYFVIKDKNTDTPLANYQIKYQVGNTHFGFSKKSNADGVIDLAINLANKNNDNSNIIPTGTHTVKYIGIIDDSSSEITPYVNDFRDFTISISPKAIPSEKEFGLALGQTLGVELIEGGKLTYQNVNFEFGMANAGVGLSYNPTLTIVPDGTNPSIWNTKISLPRGIKYNSSFGPTLKARAAVLAVNASATISNESALGSIEEYAYKLDLNKPSNVIFMGSQLFALSPSLTPSSLLMANFLYRLSSFIDLPVSEKYGYNVGMKYSGNANVVAGFSTSIKDDGAKTTDVELGIGASAFTEIGINLEGAYEITKQNGNNYYTTFTASNDHNNQLVLGGNGIGLLNEGSTSPFNLQNNAETYKIGLKKNISSVERELRNGGVTFSNEKVETIGGEFYNLGVSNSFEYSNKAIQKIGNVQQNFMSNFLFKGNTTLAPISMVSTHDARTNGFNQILAYNEKVFQQPANTFEVNDVKINSIKELTKTVNRKYSFEVAAWAGAKCELSYTAWNKFTTPFKEYKFCKESEHMILTTDYPDTTVILEVPDPDPLFTFIDILQENLTNSTINAINIAKSFVTEKSELVGKTNINFSNQTPNNGFKRLNLNAINVYQNIDEKQQTPAIVPSIISFTIPPIGQAFSEQTNIKFQYYYPENQIDAVIDNEKFKLITDVFFLTAFKDGTELSIAPLGSFKINSTFSNYDLQLAGLPQNLTPKLLFLPNGSQTWEIAGNVNSEIMTNKLGIYAIGVNLEFDNTPPTLTVVAPTNYNSNDKFYITFQDDKSGIDWSKTGIFSNEYKVPYSRNGTSNIIEVPVSLLYPVGANPTPTKFSIQIRTQDLSGNSKSFSQEYPCINALFLETIVPSYNESIVLKQANQSISVSGTTYSIVPVIINAGKSIFLNPGFEITPENRKYFKAEISGCN